MYSNDLDTIEAVIKSNCIGVNGDSAVFEKYWKPRFDRIRSMMVPPHYAKVIAEIQEIECNARAV